MPVESLPASKPLDTTTEEKFQKGIKGLAEKMAAVCKRNNFEPVEKLIKLYHKIDRIIAKNPTVDTKTGKLKFAPWELSAKEGLQLQVQIATELATYTAPKLKSVDVSGEIDQSIHVFVQRIENPLKQLGDAVVVNSLDDAKKLLATPAPVKNGT